MRNAGKAGRLFIFEKIFEKILKNSLTIRYGFSIIRYASDEEMNQISN